MKILVREFSDNGTCNYVWKKIKSVKPFYNGCYNTEDGHSYNIIQILRVTHDYRKSDYVQCACCGKVVRRGNELKHYEEQERNANCMKCEWLRLDVIPGTETHVMRSDGKVTTRTLSKPKCNHGRSWSYRATPLSEINRVSDCKYYACRRNGMRELYKDFLAENTNPFDSLLTEKAMIDKGWKYVYGDMYGRTYSNNNGKLVAVFDTNGILIKFNIIHRSHTYEVVYSDVYDKLIGRNGEFDWSDRGIADSTKNRYMKQIRQLYK